MTNPGLRSTFHQVWEITCDLCGLGSTDAPRETVEEVALAEGFVKTQDGRWICDETDDRHRDARRTNG